MLVYLLSRPDGWEVNLTDLENRSRDGLAAVKSGVKELKKAGHLKHAGTRKASGQFDTVIWEVYECPQVGNQLTDTPQVGVSSPQVDYPQVENPQVDNHTQVLSTLSIKESNSNTTTRGEVFKVYTSEIGLLTPRIADAINDYLDDLKFEPSWIIEAIHLAAENNKRNWAYCQAILKRWAVEGKTALPPKAKYQPKPAKGDNSAFFEALAKA
jgi:DnaD/phage-associated family protein